MAKAVSRNQPCPCGSGKKYKNCCLGKPPAAVRRRRALLPALISLGAIGLGVWVGMSKGLTAGLAVGGGGLMIALVAAVMRDPPPPTGKSTDAANINFGG